MAEAWGAQSRTGGARGPLGEDEGPSRPGLKPTLEGVAEEEDVFLMDRVECHIPLDPTQEKPPGAQLEEVRGRTGLEGALQDSALLQQEFLHLAIRKQVSYSHDYRESRMQRPGSSWTSPDTAVSPPTSETYTGSRSTNASHTSQAHTYRALHNIGLAYLNHRLTFYENSVLPSSPLQRSQDPEKHSILPRSPDMDRATSHSQADASLKRFRKDLKTWLID